MRAQIKPSLWMKTPSPIIKTEAISISGVAPSLSQGIWLFSRRIYTEDSMRRVAGTGEIDAQGVDRQNGR